MRQITEAERESLRTMARQIGPIVVLDEVAAAYRVVSEEMILTCAESDALELWAHRVREMLRLSRERPFPEAPA